MNESPTTYSLIPDLGVLVTTVDDSSIVSRTAFKDDQVRVILFAFAPGETLSEHTSSYPAILHFVEGQANLTLGEDALQAQPGTWVHMPANLPHSIEAKTTVKMLLLMITA